MTNATTPAYCPYLGLDIDDTVMLGEPTPDHRCYAQKVAVPPDAARQETFCLTSAYATCPWYQAGATQARTATPTPPTAGVRLRPGLAPSLARLPKPTLPGWRRGLTLLTLGSLGLTLGLALLLILANGLNLRQANALPSQSSRATTLLSAVAPTPTPTASATPIATTAQMLLTPTAALVAVSLPTAALPVAARGRFVTPTPEPGGQVLLLGSSAGKAGWWKSNDNQRNHLGDSFLYAGAYGDEAFIAAVRFDLTKVPRGAPIRQAQIRLTGLRQDQLQPGVEGLWLVQLVPESSAEFLNAADFLTMVSAPAAITLFPPLSAADLAPDQVNQWELDETARAWLAQQLLDGATAVTVRIQASIEQGEALFAWDSGLGTETKGKGPTFLLSVGPPPPTPPPLPTKPRIVATLTPIPQNVLTVVAVAHTATAIAVTTGTYTPIPYAIVTPTPFPANLATVQAVAFAQALPPVVLDTPIPGNPLVATRNAEYATAVALTTGTFTPVPTSYVTPILIPPSPPAESVATEAARVVAATALANSGAPTATPLPYNAVIGVYVYATATPGDAETAIADAVIATASAKVNGTPTPLPWNALVITPVPSPLPPTATPLPLLQSITEFTPTPTPLRPEEIPDTLPATLANKILFKTNRNGPEEIYALEPTTGEIYRINETWVYPLAQAQVSYAPDGQQQAIVKEASDRTLQIHLYDATYNSARQITALTGADIGKTAINYDPAWSPRGDLIAFVSTNSGNDEIYTVTLDGTIIKQLTVNQFEWDKHPSWSPDGSQLVFFSNRETGRRQLWLMNSDGSGQRNLSSNEYEDWDPIWVH